MEKILFAAFLMLICVPSSAQEWKEEKGDHFLVYYVSDAARPKEVIRKAEFYYNKIAEDLGYARHSNFWQWDNRVKIYIHSSQESFRQATGQPAWSHGMASYFDKTIHSIETSGNFLDEILPHEITHLVFRDFVGFKGEIPLWMDEGVAQWQEDAKRGEALALMPDLVARGEVFTLERMMTMDIRREQDPEKVALFYLQSISMVDFLVKSFGTDSFTVFCRDLRDGKGLEESLRTAYPGSLTSIEEMEDRWRKYLRTTKDTAGVPGEDVTVTTVLVS